MRLIQLLALTACIAGCATKILSPEQVTALETSMLCERAGRSYAMNQAQQFNLIITEIRNRGEISYDCVTLAGIGFRAERERRARSAAIGQAFGAGMNSMSEAFKQNAAMYQQQRPTTCTTTSYDPNTATTTCR